MSAYSRTFPRIGILVPDVEKAAEFYRDVMLWYHIIESTVITEKSVSPLRQMSTDVFGSGWGYFNIIHMSTEDKMSAEMFESNSNETPKEVEY
ncbi:MAG: catechol 2,3-dioxygenase-like lactoylglutathione lyase family enzyme [Oleiphilaceae bacterium]